MAELISSSRGLGNFAWQYVDPMLDPATGAFTWADPYGGGTVAPLFDAAIELSGRVDVGALPHRIFAWRDPATGRVVFPAASC